MDYFAHHFPDEEEVASSELNQQDHVQDGRINLVIDVLLSYRNSGL